MKLKFLMMPFAVIVSLVLVIWHIYPAWLGSDASSVSAIKAEIAKYEKDLSEIKGKKSAVSNLKNSMESDSANRDIVLNYYPNIRKDDDVINNINIIAFGEGVYLDDMDLDYLNIKENANPIRTMSLKNVEPIVVSVDPTLIPVAGQEVQPIVESIAPTALNSKISYMATTLKGSGNYNQIKNFLISLNKIGLLNNVQSFTVTKEKTSSSSSTEVKDDDGMLEFEATIGFGYFKPSKEVVSTLLNHPILKKSSFDFSVIQEKNTLLTGNYQKTEVGETSLANPFVP